jgi:hypothetical protein
VVAEDCYMNYEMGCEPSYRTWNVEYFMDLVYRFCRITVITKEVNCAIFSTPKFGTLTSIVFECLQYNSSPPSASQVIRSMYCKLLFGTDCYSCKQLRQYLITILQTHFSFYNICYVYYLLEFYIYVLHKIVCFYTVVSET